MFEKVRADNIIQRSLLKCSLKPYTVSFKRYKLLKYFMQINGARDHNIQRSLLERLLEPYTVPFTRLELFTDLRGFSDATEWYEAG